MSTDLDAYEFTSRDSGATLEIIEQDSQGKWRIFDNARYKELLLTDEELFLVAPDELREYMSDVLLITASAIITSDSETDEDGSKVFDYEEDYRPLDLVLS